MLASKVGVWESFFYVEADDGGTAKVYLQMPNLLSLVAVSGTFYYHRPISVVEIPDVMIVE